MKVEVIKHTVYCQQEGVLNNMLFTKTQAVTAL